MRIQYSFGKKLKGRFVKSKEGLEREKAMYMHI